MIASSPRHRVLLIVLFMLTFIQPPVPPSRPATFRHQWFLVKSLFAPPRIGTVEYRFQSLLDWFIISADPRVLDQQAVRSGIVHVIQDRPVFAFQQEEWARQWGIANPGGYLPWRPICAETRLNPSPAGADANVIPAWAVFDGRGMTIAVLDTGIDGAHQQLYVLDAVSFVPSSSPEDRNGHGTHVAGIIAARRDDREPVGVMPQSALLAVKVLDDTGSGYLSWIFGGFDWVIMRLSEGRDIDAINASWGGLVPREELLPLFRDVLRRLEEFHVPLVVAAGNSGVPITLEDFPCSYGDVSPVLICVGALSPTAKRACFSNCNNRDYPSVHLLAPGEDILSTLPGESLDFWSGTSMATPFVTATIGAVRHLTGDARMARRILQETAIPVYAFPRRPIGEPNDRESLVMPIMQSDPCKTPDTWALWGVLDVATAVQIAAAISSRSEEVKRYAIHSDHQHWVRSGHARTLQP